MMKRQPSGAGGKPTRFCKFLLLAAALKLALLGLVLAEPFLPAMPAFWPSARNVAASAPKKPTPAHNAVTAPALREEPASAGPLPAQPKIGTAFAASAPASPAGPVAQASAPVNNLTLDAINRRHDELNRREQDLRALEKELDRRLEQMQGLEMRLQLMLKEAEEIRADKHKHLVDVLSSMKSRQAAEVLESLDERVAVKVLAGMRGRQAGEILTYASPVKAARLSEALARLQMPLE